MRSGSAPAPETRNIMSPAAQSGPSVSSPCPIIDDRPPRSPDRPDRPCRIATAEPRPDGQGFMTASHSARSDSWSRSRVRPRFRAQLAVLADLVGLAHLEVDPRQVVMDRRVVGHVAGGGFEVACGGVVLLRAGCRSPRGCRGCGRCLPDLLDRLVDHLQRLGRLVQLLAEGPGHVVQEQEAGGLLFEDLAVGLDLLLVLVLEVAQQGQAFEALDGGVGRAGLLGLGAEPVGQLGPAGVGGRLRGEGQGGGAGEAGVAPLGDLFELVGGVVVAAGRPGARPGGNAPGGRPRRPAGRPARRRRAASG